MSSISGITATAVPSNLGSASAPVSPITASTQFAEYLYNSTLYPYKSWPELSACFVSVPSPSTINTTRSSCENLASGAGGGGGKVERYRNASSPLDPSGAWSETYYYCFVPTFGGIPAIQAAYGSDGRQTYFCNTWGGYGADGKKSGPTDTRGSAAAQASTSAKSAAEESVRGWKMKGCAVVALIVVGLVM